MTTTTFDTLKFARKLQDAGVATQHAKAEAEAIKEAFSEALNTQVATKADIQEVKTEITVVRTDIKTELREQEVRIVKWVAGLMLAQAALVATLIKLL